MSPSVLTKLNHKAIYHHFINMYRRSNNDNFGYKDANQTYIIAY